MTRHSRRSLFPGGGAPPAKEFNHGPAYPHRRHRCRRHLHRSPGDRSAVQRGQARQGADHRRQPGDRLHGGARPRRAPIPPSLQAIVHGTTTTTNALLERKIAKVGLITTKGFRDVLELGRRTRPQPYGMRGTFRPLIEREFRLEVPERMDADGKVLTPLDEAAVAEAAEEAAGAGLRGRRDPFPAQLHQSGARAPRRRDRARAVAQRLRHGGPRHPVGISRVRARRDGRGQRLGAAGARPLSHAPAAGADGQGLRPRHPGDAGQRRHDVLAARRAGGGEHGDVGAGLGRDGGGLYRPRLGPSQPHHLRHGRHLDRCRR